MPDNRKIVKSVSSGFPQYVRNVAVYDSVLEHVAIQHPEDFQKLDGVYKTIESEATAIHQSRTNPAAVIFVNTNITNSSGDPLLVPVKVYEDGTGIMSTFYCADRRDPGPLLWSTGSGQVVPNFAGKKRGQS